MTTLSSIDIKPYSLTSTSEVVAQELPRRSCGGKHDTLVKIYEFLEKKPIDGVKVPLPRGLSTEEVEPFLKTHAPQFFAAWDTLKTLYSENGDDFERFFEKPEIVELISEAQKAIKEAMTTFALPPEIESWLTPEGYYMARSSGAEDGKKTANAGGNLSCKYVCKKEISARAGDVIASYIDKRSLRNRFKSGENPFTSPLALSVSIQELIGESIGGDKDPHQIPISVVLFTNEPIYVGKEPFRIMKLSATFGHGEGVVGNQGILTDTAFVLQSLVNPAELYVWMDAQEKPERLAPVQTEQGVTLERLPNPEELVSKPALSTPLLKRLFHLGKEMEEFFQEPTDMELVIKNDIIHIVQARSINREPSTPSYLDLDASTLKNPHELKVLVPGPSAALVIHSQEELLVRDTLEMASDDVRATHRVVITREDEPLNSHPIIRMTETEMPCLYHPEGIDALIGELEQGAPLAICTQQGVVAVAEEAVIKQGAISHPAPLACPHDPMVWRKKKKGIPHELQELVKRIRMEKIKEQALDCFEELKKEPLLSTVTRKVQYPSLVTFAHTMQERLTATLQELGQALAHAERMQVLFYAKAIETLLWGAGFSVVQLQEVSEALCQYAEKVGKKEALFAEDSLITCLMPETGRAWVEFLVEVETTHSQEEGLLLKKLLNSIGGARSVWLTFFFDPARKASADSKELLKALLEGFSQVLVEDLRKIGADD